MYESTKKESNLKMLEWHDITNQLAKLGYLDVVIAPNSFQQRGNGFYRYCSGYTSLVRFFGITQEETLSFHLSMTDDDLDLVDAFSRALGGVKPYCCYKRMLTGKTKEYCIMFYEWTIRNIENEILILKENKQIRDLIIF